MSNKKKPIFFLFTFFFIIILFILLNNIATHLHDDCGICLFYSYDDVFTLHYADMILCYLLFVYSLFASVDK